jgi:hypothetical protein
VNTKEAVINFKKQKNTTKTKPKQKYGERGKPY